MSTVPPAPTPPDDGAGHRAYGAAPRTTLARRIGFWGATLSGVGLILGAGIYVLIAAATERAGSAVWASFLIASLVTAATGLSYAELSSMYAHAGASSYYVRAAFGRRAGFLAGWLSLSVSIVGAAAVALGFGGYAAALAGGGHATLFALLLVVAAGAIAVLGARETVVVAIALTLIEAGGLVFVVVVGASHVGTRSLLDTPTGFDGVLVGATVVFFAFQGFEQMATLAEEMRDPVRTLPRAILAAIAISTTLYLLVAVVATSVLDWHDLAASGAPLADLVAHTAGARWADVISTAALFATANTVLMLLATGARLLYGMARADLAPRALASVEAHRATPAVAIAVVTGLSALGTLAGDIGFVAQVTNFGFFAIFIAVNGAAIALRRRAPDLARPFRVPGSLGRIPLIPVVGLISCAALSLTMERSALLVGAAVTLVGLTVAITTHSAADHVAG